MAHKVVLQHIDLKRKWMEAVDWLQEELNRVLMFILYVYNYHYLFYKLNFNFFRKHQLEAANIIRTIVGHLNQMKMPIIFSWKGLLVLVKFYRKHTSFALLR